MRRDPNPAKRGADFPQASTPNQEEGQRISVEPKRLGESRKGGDKRPIVRSSEEKASVFLPKPSEAVGERAAPTSRRRARSTLASRRDRPKDVDLLYPETRLRPACFAS